MPCFGGSRCWQLEGSLVSLSSSAAGQEGAGGPRVPHARTPLVGSVRVCDLFCWVLLGPVGSCWVLLGFVGSCWVLLGPVGFSWVLSSLEYEVQAQHPPAVVAVPLSPQPALAAGPCPPQLYTKQHAQSVSPSPPPLGFLTLPLLLPLLELPEPPGPRVPPLDHQAGFVRNDAALVGRVLVVAQQQILLHGLDFGALAGYVLGVDPQGLVSAPDPVAALFVDGDDVHRELPPVRVFFRLQDVDLDSWKKKQHTRQERKRCYCLSW